MSEKKEQKIIVLIDNTDSDKNLILHGLKLAAAFQKELCFIYIIPKNKPYNSGHIQNILTGYQKIVSNEIPSLPVNFITLKGNPKDLIDPLADEHEAILIIACSSLFKKWSGAVRSSPVPFLFVNKNQTNIPDYKKIIIPVDLRGESKDAILWASYFARFNNSGINVLAANDKAKENIKSVQKNIFMMKKLFSKLKVGMKVFKGSSNSLKIQFEALELAKTSKADLIIILGSSYISFIDLIVGLPENKIIKMAGEMPVLMINPRKDMYIMCD